MAGSAAPSTTLQSLTVLCYDNPEMVANAATLPPSLSSSASVTTTQSYTVCQCSSPGAVLHEANLFVPQRHMNASVLPQPDWMRRQSFPHCILSMGPHV